MTDGFSVTDYLKGNRDTDKILFDQALKVKLKYLDNNVHLRGLIEYSNVCRKDCYYCGLRKSNKAVNRYTLTDEQVFECAKTALKLNYGSVAIQSGERQDREFTDKIEYLVREIKRLSDGQLGITLSCGEQTKETFQRWFNAGAHRYLLRIEASNQDLYYKIHPENELHSYDKRLQCLNDLQQIGYQVGTGVMIGLPFQSYENLAEDLDFFVRQDVAMVGMGAYIPHQQTPLYEYKDLIPSGKERLQLTLRMIALLRIRMPKINMVSATANQTLDKMGREKAVMVGANVIMPNLSPTANREDYSIYPDKACVSDTPLQCYSCLDIRMKSINHRILYNEWGDSVAFTEKYNKR